MISNKLDEFTSPVMRPWFGDTKNTIDFREFMDERKIVFIKLNSQWQSLTKLLGNIIVAQILDAAYSRSNIPSNKRKQFNVYLDEVQNFASPDFSRLFTEARKFGLGITIAHQVLEQLDLVVKATCRQAGNIVVFQISPDNAKEVAATFDCSPQPGIPRYEPIKTPVMEPIQFMVPRGVYPKDTTRLFIEQYGELLVDNAKKEDDIERDARRAQQQYHHDLAIQTLRDEFNASIPKYSTQSYSVGFVAPPAIQVNYDWRTLLKGINYLLYQAMLYGKAGRNPDTIPIPSQFLNGFIRAMNLEGGRYLALNDHYTSYVENLGIQVIDVDERYKDLQQEHDDLRDMQWQLQNFQEQQTMKIRRLKKVIKGEDKQEEDDTIRYLIREYLANFSQDPAIVELNGMYYIAYYSSTDILLKSRPPSYGIYTSTDISWSEYMFKYGSEGEPIVREIRSASCTSLQAAIEYYSYIVQGKAYEPDDNWKLLKNVIRYKEAWQKRKESVFITEFAWCFVPRWIIRAVYRGQLAAKGYFEHFKYQPFAAKNPRASFIKQYTLALNTWTLRPNVLCQDALIDSFFTHNRDIFYDCYQSRGWECKQRGLHYCYFGNLTYKKFGEEMKQRLKLDQMKIYTPDIDLAMDRLPELPPKREHTKVAVIGQTEQQREEAKQREIQCGEALEKVEKEQQIIVELLAEKAQYILCFNDLEQQLRTIMRELADDPVEADSGLMQEVPGPEIPTPEVEARIANQLKQLYPYTARVRIASGEYTIKTIDSTGRVSDNDLAKRIEDIQKQNIRDGYLRLRSVVDAEIASRRNPPSAAAAPVPAKPQPKTPPAPAKATANPPAQPTDISQKKTEPLPNPSAPPSPVSPLQPTPRKRKLKP